MSTLFSALQRAARTNQRARAVVEGDRVLTYEDLLRSVHALSAELESLGAEAGDRIGILLPNGADFVISFFAGARLGAALVPLNPLLQPREIAQTVSDARVSTILTNGTLSDRCDGTDATLLDAREIYDAMLDRVDDEQCADLARADSVALILYSSGSTARPKRIERTHYNLLYEEERLIASLDMSPVDRVLGVAPFTHVNGLTRSAIASVLSGATLFPVARYERRSVAQLISNERISIFIGVPFMFAMLAETRWREPIDFSSLRHCVSSSAPLRHDTFRRFHEQYGLYVRQLYGCTETGAIAVNLDGEPADSWDSVGTPLDGVEVEIFAEGGDPLPAGRTGDIGIKSPAATTCYPDRPDETAAAFRNGFFFPGDVGYKDERGRTYLVGRKSLFINRGGYNVNPYEIEEVLEGHPKVGQVAVVGVMTEHGDEKIKAVIVATESCDEVEIVEYCRARLAAFKIPSLVEFRDELPKSSTGKVLRKVL